MRDIDACFSYAQNHVKGIEKIGFDSVIRLEKRLNKMTSIVIYHIELLSKATTGTICGLSQLLILNYNSNKLIRCD